MWESHPCLLHWKLHPAIAVKLCTPRPLRLHLCLGSLKHPETAGLWISIEKVPLHQLRATHAPSWHQSTLLLQRADNQHICSAEPATLSKLKPPEASQVAQRQQSQWGEVTVIQIQGRQMSHVLPGCAANERSAHDTRPLAEAGEIDKS